MRFTSIVIKFFLIFLFVIGIAISKAYSINYNISIPMNYKFTGKDSTGSEFESDKTQGVMVHFGFTQWGIGLETYETKVKNTSEDVNLKTNLYNITYGATGDGKSKGFWKYFGAGYGFGTDELVCSYCKTYFYKSFAMQYILLFDIPFSKSFSVKASLHQKTSKIRHKTKAERDDFSATVINIGLGF